MRNNLSPSASPFNFSSMSVSGSDLVGLHLQSYRQAGTRCPSHSTPSRERHNNAGQGGAIPFARLDQSRFHTITNAADHVDTAAHPLKRYDVRSGRLN